MAQVYPVNPQEYPFGIAPEPGYTYGYVHGACDACTEAGFIQAGHFACHLAPIPEGWEAVTVPILTDSGFVVLVRRRL